MARPRCPHHPNSKVWFDGTYGAPGRKRQRLKCVIGEQRHVFTEPLPRQRTQHRDCVECERSLGKHEGPQAPRRQHYTVREVATTLLRVGQGISYRGAGRMLRTDAGRMKFTSTGWPFASQDSAVVEDWVEVFAPVVFEPYAPSEWPPLVMLDDLPFEIRSSHTAGGSKIAFRVFGALRYGSRNEHPLLRLEAFADKKPANWAKFLGELSGRPQAIVCDNESGMLKGIEKAWPHSPDEPTPMIWLSHWHLHQALARLLHRYGRLSGALKDALDRAFQNRQNWDDFVALGQRSNFTQFERWLDKPAHCWWAGQVSMGERVAWQLSHQRGLPSTTTSALEQHFREIKKHITPRKFAFRNRERTNRLLQLMQLHLNGQANEGRYAQQIRRVLETNGGHPAARRIITDLKGHPSLWV